MVGCGDGINVFTISDDIELGIQVRDEIAANPQDYPILDEALYPDAYLSLYDVRDAILGSGQVEYADRFDWETYIIDDDETLNAFCAPGGYIYVYSGLMRFLEYEDELAGVMGHEIAHAANRHSTQQLTKMYGIAVLIDLVLDDGTAASTIAEIAGALVNLSFSRSDETESDASSVRYLCETHYAADGAAGFFEKLENNGFPEFLSTHPSSDTRIHDIRSTAAAQGCSVEYGSKEGYQMFLDSLP